jgi:exopolysaccharide transport family protein
MLHKVKDEAGGARQPLPIVRARPMPASTQAPQRAQWQLGSTVDPSAIWRIVQRRKRLILTVLATALALALLFVLVSKPLYTAGVTVLVDPRKQKVLSSDAVIPGLGLDTSGILSEVELITSPHIAHRVIEKANLKLDPEFGGGTSLVGQLVAVVASALKGSKAQVDEVGEPAHLDADAAILKRVQDRLNVKRRGLTYVIDIEFTASHPSHAARIANTFADEYLVDQLEAKYDMTRRATGWLNSRMGDLREQVRAAEAAVEQYKIDNKIVDAAGETLSEKQVGQLNEQLIIARAKTAEAKAKVDQLKSVVKEGGQPAAFADALSSQVITSLRTRIAEVARTEAELTSQFGDRHPAVIGVRSQMSDIRRQIQQELARVVSAAENDFAVAVSRERSLMASLEDLKRESGETKQASVRLRELQREAAASRALFEGFLARFKEASEVQTLQTSDTRIISRATPPIRTSHPKTLLILGVALVLGLGLGIAIAFLMEQIDDCFRTGTDIEDFLGVPNLATLPAIKDLGLRKARLTSVGPVRRLLQIAGLAGTRPSNEVTSTIRDLDARIIRYAIDKPLSTYAEAVRSLRAGIRFANVDRDSRVIIVTSALPSEGKSTTAMNLARYAARNGEKVLLVDGDLRHPVLTKAFLGNCETGLAEMLAGTAAPEQVLVYDKETSLRFLPASVNRTRAQSAEVLGSERFRTFLENARQHFELIIVDTAPVVPVVDSRIIASQVDGIVLVVAWAETRREPAEFAVRVLRRANGRVLGVALNNVDQKLMRYYSYYESSDYGGKYSYYYSSG